MLDEEALRARFELMQFDEEGVLLDRAGGGLYRLNRTANEIWAALIGGRTVASIAAGLVGAFGIAPEQAERDTRAALEQFPSVPTTPSDVRFRWAVTPRGYGFFADGLIIGDVDPRGDALQMHLPARSTPEAAALHLKSLAPKVLALRDIHVLHAAAVERAGAVLVFSGRSGAGKTTTARSFAQAGARLISEDLLVLASRPSSPVAAVLRGEAVIGDWAQAGGRILAADPDRAIDCRVLDSCLEGERRPLSGILLVDALRRGGAHIVTETLAPVDALMALVESVFFASQDAGSWRRQLESLREVLLAVPAAQAVMPDGLDQLRQAVAAFSYNGMMAS